MAVNSMHWAWSYQQAGPSRQEHVRGDKALYSGSAGKRLEDFSVWVIYTFIFSVLECRNMPCLVLFRRCFLSFENGGA